MVHPAFSSILSSLSDSLSVDITAEEGEMLVAECDDDITLTLAFDDKTESLVIAAELPLPPGTDPQDKNLAPTLLHLNYELWNSRCVSIGFSSDDKLKLTENRFAGNIDGGSVLKEIEGLMNLCHEVPELLANASKANHSQLKTP